MLVGNDESAFTIDLLETVLATARAVFRKPVTSTDNFFDLGGDSLCAVEFGMLLEERLGAEMDMNALLDADNLADMADVVAGCLGRTRLKHRPCRLPVPRRRTSGCCAMPGRNQPNWS
jgi:acyl carrier protein